MTAPGLTATDLLVPAAFLGLLLATLAAPERRRRLARKSRSAWILDLSGLLVQGVGIPLLQLLLVTEVLTRLFPGYAGTWQLSPWGGLLLGLVGVDYLYYWNHRLLHGRHLWNLHQVHHSMTDRDVLGTSRNTLWSSLFLVYLWSHAAALFLLADPRGYALAVAVTASLDLWRHSAFDPPPGGWLHRLLDPVLVLPRDHARHHGPGSLSASNFGANWKFWDRLHGTYHGETADPEELGIPCALPLWRQLLWPLDPSRQGSS